MKFKKMNCPQCKGERVVRCPLAPTGGLTLCESDCPQCKGEGEIQCPWCGGKGFVKIPK